ncbi:MAG: DUF4442 domain-containing protein [Sediminibacterium sp.]
MNPKFENFQKIILHPVKFRFFLLQKLPSALIAGLRVQEITSMEAVITVKHKWLNQNPFRSMYFAVQSMAAEMSTGLLAFGQLYQRNPPVSMLVVGMEAKFHKKAVGKISFYCEDGLAIAKAVEAATQTGQGQTIQCYSIGKNEAGETVSEFWFTWSFKAK